MADDRVEKILGDPFASSDFAADWPEDVRQMGSQLFGYDLETIRGKERLGTLSLDSAPKQVSDIRAIVRSLGLESWKELPDQFLSAFPEHLQQVNDKIEQMLALAATTENVTTKRERFSNQMQQQVEWFQREAKPLALRERIQRAMQEQVPAGRGRDLAKIGKEVESLGAMVRSLNHELDSRAEALSQVRAEAGESAGEELSATFTARAEAHKDTAVRWLWMLVASGPIAIAGAVVTFLLLRPDEGSGDPHSLSSVGLALFILGILAFGIRVCAQNYRVNRHLEAIALSRGTAISTFQRLSASVDDAEIRSAVILTLAQSVFATEETGLVDGAGDHVTLIERAVLPHLPKASS